MWKSVVVSLKARKMNKGKEKPQLRWLPQRRPRRRRQQRRVPPLDGAIVHNPWSHGNFHHCFHRHFRWCCFHWRVAEQLTGRQVSTISRPRWLLDQLCDRYIGLFSFFNLQHKDCQKIIIVKVNFLQKGCFYIEGFHFYKMNIHFFCIFLDCFSKVFFVKFEAF